MRGGLGLSGSLLVVLIATVPTVAQPLRADRVLGVREGLTGSIVLSVARDADGFVWIGTQLGLDRWDGVRLQTFAAPEGARALAVDPAGSLWVAGRAGVIVHRADGALWRLRGSSPASDPLAGGLRAVLPDERGGAWVGTEAQGIVHVVPHRARSGRVRGLPSDSVRVLLRPRRAATWLWVGSPAGVSRVPAAGGRSETRRPGGDPSAVSACTDADSLIWCGTRGGGLHALDPATGATRRSLRVGAEVSALVASRARPGTLWVGTRGRGVQALDVRTGVLGPATTPDPRLDRADALALAESPDGLVWIGTLGGLYRADTHPLPFTAGAALPGAPSVTALHEARSRPGVVWLGTIRNGLVRLDRRTGAQTTWFATPGPPPPPIFAIHEDRRGRLWLGGPGGALLRFDPATGATEPTTLTRLPGSVVYSIRDDVGRPGVLWVSFQGAGLVEFDADARRVRRRWAPDAPGHARLDAGVVWSTLVQPAQPGVRWLATRDNGLLRLDVRSGRLAPVTGCGLDRDATALTTAPDGALWIGRPGGLVRYVPDTGACHVHAPDDGRPADVYAVTLDARGRLWASTRTAGLLVFDPAREAWTRYTTVDGLPTDEFYIPAHGRTAGGEWLLGGSGGWLAFRPGAVGIDRRAPHVAITGLRVDGRPVALLLDRSLVLRPDQNDLSFEFAALSLRQPAANRYRVRLDANGRGGTWAALGARADVRFPYLAPGRYTLRVAGAGPDGAWDEALPVAVTIRPPVWRRGGFWALAALLAIGLVAMGQQARIRQMRRLETTRRRIADDLHDDIGSKVSTVALRLDLAGRNADLPPADRQRLADLAVSARDVVTDLRDAIWFVDAGHDSLGALVDRVEVAAGQMLAGRPYTVDRPSVLPDVSLPMERRRHVFLWVREALHNACKHGTGRVLVGVRVEAGRLRLSVEDEGPGFDPAHATRGRGLASLLARAEALGGDLRLESAPGHRTRVALNVPLR